MNKQMHISVPLLALLILSACEAGLRLKEAQAQTPEAPSPEAPQEDAPTPTSTTTQGECVNFVYNQPYSLVVQEVTPEIVEFCQADENCMDVTKLPEDCPEGEVWSPSTEECLPEVICSTDFNCQLGESCTQTSSSKACLPL